MTDKNLTELLAETKAIVEAATPGPWELNKHNPTEILQIYSAEFEGINSGEWVCEPVDEENGAFIAHARSMMPALIEALELAVLQRTEVVRGVRAVFIQHTGIDLEPEPELSEMDQALADIIRKAGDR